MFIPCARGNYCHAGRPELLGHVDNTGNSIGSSNFRARRAESTIGGSNSYRSGNAAFGSSVQSLDTGVMAPSANTSVQPAGGDTAQHDCTVLARAQVAEFNPRGRTIAGVGFFAHVVINSRGHQSPCKRPASSRRSSQRCSDRELD